LPWVTFAACRLPECGKAHEAVNFGVDSRVDRSNLIGQRMTWRHFSSQL
jgi:hypothetical protein